MSSTQNVSGLTTIDACVFFKRFAADAAAEPGSRGFGTFVSNMQNRCPRAVLDVCQPVAEPDRREEGLVRFVPRTVPGP